jgi:hypothetical protein
MSTTQRKSKNTIPPGEAKENLEHNNSTAQSVVEPKTENKNDNFCKKRKLDSQEMNIQYRKYLELVKGVTFESIALNDRISDINNQLLEVRKKRAIISKKREIIGYW